MIKSIGECVAGSGPTKIRAADRGDTPGMITVEVLAGLEADLRGVV